MQNYLEILAIQGELVEVVAWLCGIARHCDAFNDVPILLNPKGWFSEM